MCFVAATGPATTAELVEFPWDQVPAEFQTYPGPDADVDAHAARFRAWCAAHDVFYYARPREDFSRREARQLARAAGRTRLLLEDMS